MDQINIDIPSDLKDFVDHETTHGGYCSASDYIRDLIYREQKRKAEARLEGLLLEGLNSGPMEEMTPEDWNNLRDRLRKRSIQRKQTA